MKATTEPYRAHLTRKRGLVDFLLALALIGLIVVIVLAAANAWPWGAIGGGAVALAFWILVRLNTGYWMDEFDQLTTTQILEEPSDHH